MSERSAPVESMDNLVVSTADSELIEDSRDIIAEAKEVVDETETDESVAPVRYDISSYGADYDVEGIVKRLNRGDILVPPFQRAFVWSLTEASKFIESLLLGLPVPGIFLSREEQSHKLLVIDGQQRLKSLQFFYDGKFNPKEDDKRVQVFKLTGVQPQFDGRTYATLEEPDKVQINDSLIHATIIKQDSPKDDDTSIYEIFNRLNSQGRRLTPQEIRVAIDHGLFMELLKTLNNYEPWRDIYGKKSNRLKDQELILRFLALFFLSDEGYVKPMDTFLNRFSKKYRNADEKFLDAAAAVFKETIDVVYKCIGKKAFRPISALNAAVFDSVMVGLARRIMREQIATRTSVIAEKSAAITTAYQALLVDPSFSDLTNRATSNEANVQNRIAKATEAFAGI